MTSRIHNPKRFFTLFTLAILSQLGLTTAIAETQQGEQANPAPIWADMKPTAQEPSTGFVPPPPTQQTAKLSARIVATTTQAKQGETITFSIETTQDNVRYYWVSGSQKSNKPVFVVNTGSLEPGKHRVRATVTNQERQQAHASLSFNVMGDEEPAATTKPQDAAPATEETATPDTESAATEAPTEKQKPTPFPVTPVETDSSVTADGKVIELPAVGQGEAQSADISVDNDSDDDVLRIIPAKASIGFGETAVFMANSTSVDGYKFQWKFADRRSDSDQFEISADDMEPGSYNLHLTTIDENNIEQKAQANVIVRGKSPQLASMPNLTGVSFGELKAKLESEGLYLGNVLKRPDDNAVGAVVAQEPAAGQSIAQGSLVNVVIGITTSVPVPSLLGQKTPQAREALRKADLKVGKIEYQIDDNAIGMIIGQNPSAENTLKRGSEVGLIIGKATPKPPEVRIQPALAVADKGKQVEFTAVIVNPELDDQLTFKWSFGQQTHNGRSYIINTDTLDIGKYPLTLEVTDSVNQKVDTSATIDVTAKTLVMLELTGKPLEEVRQLVANAGLKVGNVETIETDIETEQVTEQQPSAGEQIAVGSTVDITVEKPRPAENITISLNADTDSIKAGESVTFTTELSPAQDDKDIHYVYTINAEKKANVQPQLEWKPEKEGIYTVTVAAFNNTGMLAKSTPMTIGVSPAWEQPVAKIIPEMQVINQGARVEFTSTSTYDLNSTLNYKWVSETDHSGGKKHFAFDTTGVAPGSYEVNLTVTDTQENQSTTKAMVVIQGGVKAEENSTESNGQGNVAKVSADSDVKPEIKLSASRRIVSTGTALKIKASSNIPLSSAYYYFEPGDGAKTKWLGSNELTHTYSDFGTYIARAAVKHGDKVYYSDSITIWVWSPILFVVTAATGALFYLLMWWRIRRVPSAKKHNKAKAATAATVIEEQVPLNTTEISHSKDSEEPGIFTEHRERDERTVSSVLLRALIQFILGILISVVVLYVILKAMNLM